MKVCIAYTVSCGHAERYCIFWNTLYITVPVYFDSSLFSEITIFPEILCSIGLMLSFIICIYSNLHWCLYLQYASFIFLKFWPTIIWAHYRIIIYRHQAWKDFSTVKITVSRTDKENCVVSTYASNTSVVVVGRELSINAFLPR